MLNRKLTAIAIASLATIGLTTVTFAGDLGAYTTNGNGAATRHGVYVMGALGYGKIFADGINIQGTNSLTADTDSTGGFAQRVGVGYQFNTYFGLETGLNNYKIANFTNVTTGGAIATTTQQDLRMHSYDVLATAKLPLHINNYYLEGAAGVAYVTANYDGAANNTLHKIRPEVRAGIGYNATRHVAVDITYAYTWGAGNSTHFDQVVGNKGKLNYIPRTGVLAAGFTYNFFS